MKTVTPAYVMPFCKDGNHPCCKEVVRVRPDRTWTCECPCHQPAADLTGPEPSSYVETMLADLVGYAGTHAPGLSVSAVGHCRASAVLTLAGVHGTESQSPLASLRGTGLHEFWQAARAKSRPHLLHEVTVEVAGMVGHVDEFDPVTGRMTDLKTTRAAGLDRAIKDGPDLQKRCQVALYAEGLRLAGHSVREVGIVWWDVEGDRLHEWTSTDWTADLAAALAWLERVRTADVADVPSLRDKPSFFCTSYCGQVEACRGPARELPELDSDVAEVAERYKAAKDAEVAAKREQSALRPALLGITGTAGVWEIRTSGGNPKTEDVEDVDALREAWTFLHPSDPPPTRTVSSVTNLTLSVKRRAS